MKPLFVLVAGALLALLLAARGGSASQRANLVLGPADLAPADLRADEPKPGKWWLKRDAKEWGAPDGVVLLTGWPTGAGKPFKPAEWTVPPADRFTSYRVPKLTVDPKARGWYRIYVGLYHQKPEPHPRLLARLSGEPYPEYLQAPLDAPGHVAEVYWKAADLTGRTLQFEQPPAPMPFPGHGLVAGLSHVKLVPVADDQLAAVKKEDALPPPERRLFGLLDTPDELFWWGTAETEDDVRAIVYRHARAGFGRIYWRGFGSAQDNSLAVPESAPRWSDTDEQRWRKANKTPGGWMDYINLLKRFDLLKVAVDQGKKDGCAVHAWVRLTNLNREPYANFWHDHRKFVAQMVAGKHDPKTGKWTPLVPYRRSPYPRVLSFAYPEVRAFYVKVFKQLASTGTRGILIDLLRHPPIAGYEPIVSEAFKKKHGSDMELRDVYHDPLVNEHLAQYLRQFLVELRKELGKEIELSVRSSGPDKYALRAREWVAEGLIDTVIDGNWYSGFGPRATIDATVAAMGERGKAFAIAETLDVDPAKGWRRREGWASPEAILAFARHYSGRGVARFGLYESTVFTWFPDRRRAIREAGWLFEPSKKAR
jgi:hypothetical protein